MSEPVTAANHPKTVIKVINEDHTSLASNENETYSSGMNYFDQIQLGQTENILALLGDERRVLTDLEKSLIQAKRRNNKFGNLLRL